MGWRPVSKKSLNRQAQTNKRPGISFLSVSLLLILVYTIPICACPFTVDGEEIARESAFKKSDAKRAAAMTALDKLCS